MVAYRRELDRKSKNQPVSYIGCIMILDSSMVEHAAVNRGVVGSSHTRGGGVNHFVINSKRPVNKMFTGFLFCKIFIIK